MTSSTVTKRSRHRSGFTLIELLVTMGIIVLIIGITLPILMKARKNATRTRIAMDLQVIKQGLDAYRLDFKDYPQVDHSGSSPITATDRLGAVTLCWALLAPGPAISTPPPPATNLTISGDGADGPGFRIRGTQGQVYGPYIPPGKFTITGTSNLDSTINDIRGFPYLYFPAFRGANINAANGFVGNYTTPPTPPATIPMFNYGDNSITTNNLFKIADMEQILGDTDASGSINGSETPATTGPYLLWSAGSDELWGYDSSGKTDDVTNFN